MIKQLSLKEFKIHHDLDLKFGQLTLLTGQNGMGKSSVIQSLLLLRQSFIDGIGVSGVNLKGKLVDLGSSVDIECQSCEKGVLGICIQNDDDKLDFSFPYADDQYSTYLKLDGDNISLDELTNCSLFTSNFQYISAFRYGPKQIYSRDTNIVESHRQISEHNGECEYAVYYLKYYGRRHHCLPGLCIGEDESDLLENQVEKWMQCVSPKVSINIEPVDANFKLNYKFSRDENTVTTDMSAINVGYGITYVLPILVAVLSAEPGALLLIENPEAHIHPRAQAELMKLFMLAAKSGIQLVIETHSDHIVNGALVSIAQDSKNKSLVQCYFFERDEHSHVSVPRQLEFLDDGRIANPPVGFFDQIDIDMRKIIGLD